MLRFPVHIFHFGVLFGNTSIFYVTIGCNNRSPGKISSLTREPEFNSFVFDGLKPLKFKNPIDDSPRFTLQDNDEENDEVILMKDMQIISN
jgi:hypothetical protein